MKGKICFILLIAGSFIWESCSKSGSDPVAPPPVEPPDVPVLPVYGGEDTLGQWKPVALFDAGTFKLGSISFPTKTSGYITNNYYDNVVKLQSTSDGGVNWSAPASFGSINRIQFLTAGIGWAYRPGIPGWNLNQTVNGGGTWYIRYQNGLAYTLIRNICFINDTVAYALTLQGQFLKINKPLTITGAIDVRETNIPQNINDVAFANLKNGWCTTENSGLGTGGRIFATADSGKTWTQQLAVDNEFLTFITFADANNGWVSTSGNSNFIYRTTDGGNTWTKITIRKADNSRVATSKMIFISALNGYMISTNEILKTIDGGLSWTRSLKIGKESVVDFCFTKPDMLWAISATRVFSLVLP